jgi:hypothetical protein
MYVIGDKHWAEQNGLKHGPAVSGMKRDFKSSVPSFSLF